MMVYKILEWDNIKKAQVERDATAKEIEEIDARKAESVVKNAAEDVEVAIAAVKAEMAAADLSIIRALAENDAVRIAAHVKEQEKRRAKLK